MNKTRFDHSNAEINTKLINKKPKQKTFYRHINMSKMLAVINIRYCLMQFPSFFVCRIYHQKGFQLHLLEVTKIYTSI